MSSILRAFFRPGEMSFRAKEMQSRLFWQVLLLTQRESNIPTHVRGKRDGILFTLTTALSFVGLYAAVDLIADFVKVFYINAARKVNATRSWPLISWLLISLAWRPCLLLKHPESC